MRVMLVHSGTSWSTSDVYDGIEAGLRANEVEIVAYRLDEMIKTFGVMVKAAHESGQLKTRNPNGTSGFLLHLAGAELVNVALENDVDAVIVVCGLLLGPKRARLLAKLGIPVACYGTEAPYFLEDELSVASAYTHWFTNERRCVEALGRETATFYLPHAWHPERHGPGPIDEAKRCDAVFIGSGFEERQALFGGVDWSGIDFVRHGTEWEGSDRYLDVVASTETAAWYRSARVCLNHHRTTTRPGTGQHIAAGAAESLGPRAYEIPACGGFMVCDDSRAELGDVYGDTVPSYKSGSSESLEGVVRHWLANDGRRESLAREQFEAVQPHSWTQRVQQMLVRMID